MGFTHPTIALRTCPMSLTPTRPFKARVLTLECHDSTKLDTVISWLKLNCCDAVPKEMVIV